MERIERRERVGTFERVHNEAVRTALASGGMIAFLVALALLFVVTAPT